MRFKANDFIRGLLPIWEHELQIVRKHRAITPFFITGPSYGIDAAIVGLNPRTTDSCLYLHGKTKRLPRVIDIVQYRQISSNYGDLKPTPKDVQMRHFLSYLKPVDHEASNQDNIFDSYKSLGACKINLCSIPSDKWNPKAEEDGKIRKALQEWHYSGVEDASLNTITEGFLKDESMFVLSFWMTPTRFKEKLDKLLSSKGYAYKAVSRNCWEWTKRKKRIILGPNQGFPSNSFR